MLQLNSQILNNFLKVNSKANGCSAVLIPVKFLIQLMHCSTHQQLRNLITRVASLIDSEFNLCEGVLHRLAYLIRKGSQGCLPQQGHDLDLSSVSEDLCRCASTQAEKRKIRTQQLVNAHAERVRNEGSARLRAQIVTSADTKKTQTTHGPEPRHVLGQAH